MRRYDVFLIILAIFALLSFGAGDLVIALIFSMVGIPLALLILILPAFALILGLARLLDLLLLSRLLPKGTSGIGAVCTVLVLLAGVSVIANNRQSSALVALQSGDHDDLSRPLPDQVIALVSAAPTQDCTDFCQRLLLTGQATAVVIAQGETLPNTGTFWQIKDQPTCPPVALPVGAARMRIKDEARGTAPQADLLIGAGIAAGHCLIATPSTLGIADVVIIEAILQEPKRDPGFSFGDDLIAAKRYSVWVRTDQRLTEQARWTYVSARQMFPLAVPIVEPGMDRKTKIGFARMRAANYGYDPGFDSFADQTLGLRLSLAAAPNPVLANGEDPLLAALKTPGPLPANIVQLADGKVRAMMNAKVVTPADRAVFLALLADPRMALQWGYEGATATLLREAPPDFVATLAKIGFARLNGLLLPDQHGELLDYQEKYALLKRINPIKEQIEFIGDVLAQLPDTALQPYGPTIFALAKDRENRTEPYKLLIRLNAFGDPGAQALVDLLAAAADRSDKDAPLYRDHWQHAYIAAMRGLCQMGPTAAPVLPQILTLAEIGTVDLSSGPYGRMTLVTLIRLGQPVDAIHSLAARQQYPISTELIDYAVLHASDLKACYF